MFDADTVTLIKQAPALEGLSLDDLPQRLTNAYASIVATRIRLRGAGEDPALPSETAAMIAEMRRLAFTLEAFVSTLPDREDRAAAAFVAGVAHHVSLLAETVTTGRRRASYLDAEAISPEVSATLLLLVAEASADAAEMAKAIVVETEDPVERALLNAIAFLANGSLQRIVDTPLPVQGTSLTIGPSERAVSSLFLLMLQGVQSLAASMLGDSAVERLALPSAVAIFQRAKELCVAAISGVFGEGATTPFSIYSGPLHLASLLLSTANDLPQSGLISIMPPGGVDAARWSSILQETAKKRPYIWRNHRQAVDSGYLESGISAAVSFPTGAGKSTLAELKIAAALLKGAKVVFLAPTLALVDQTATALAATFPWAEVQRERPEELLFAETEVEILPGISVMTPERCLAILSFDREIFADVGLLIFDECHLLHPRDQERSHRAISAMLCFLNFTAIAPSADLLLLSAMMKNAEEMGHWIEDLTGRPCRALTLTWKPTRQVRGCVVYEADEIGRLNARLAQVRQEVPNKNAPVALERELKLRPFGFFCLRQTWQSKARRDYALLPLLDDPVQLATGTANDGRWYLTPNGNQVATSIAAATSARKLKTLVFTQTIRLCNSAAAGLNKALGTSDIPLTNEEKRLYQVAVEEAGGPKHVYINIDAGGNLPDSCVSHHGLLMPAERHLHESVFKRPDGVPAMIATSTLAQGMNLPSEVVIISGDSRFDADANRMERLEAYELLNTAGRAGRAGESAYGFVLVVPSKVVHFNNQTSTIHGHWTELQAIFAQSDQCLEIDDPTTAILDEIHAAATAQSDNARYLLSRLPLGSASDEGGPDQQTRTLLARSFGAYRARAWGDQAWIASRTEAAIAARHADPATSTSITWAERLAAGTGVEVAVVKNLGGALTAALRSLPALTMEARSWVIHWLTGQPAFIVALLRRESLEGLFGTPYKRLSTDEERGQHVLPIVDSLLKAWMGGSTLSELELAFGTPSNRLGKCENAREFVLKIVPELAYIFGLPLMVLRALQADTGATVGTTSAFETLGACVREGFDQSEKLALRLLRGRRSSRVAVHRQFAGVQHYLDPKPIQEEFGDTKDRVARAMEIYDLI